MKKIKKTIEKVKEQPYKVSVKIFGRTFTANGETVKDALNNVIVTNAKGKSVVIVEKGEARKERILMPPVTFRLFNTKGLSKEIALKQASILFGGI